MPPEKIRRNSKYCSARCRKKWVKEGKPHVFIGELPTGTVGAISELLVAIDLLSKGYEVFRALSQACSVDLAILFNKQLFTIEVRTSTKNKDGKISINPLKTSRADIGALVCNGEIVYVPPLPEFKRDE